jgi:pimeloyl-ACP methyl ester carboxylesterase
VARRAGLVSVAALAAGGLVGAAMEEVLYRRVLRRHDPEADEPIGSVPGRTLWVEATDGTRLYARSYGPRDAELSIVFAHGITENNVIWHYLVRDVRASGRFHLVTYDARGHGNSGPAKGPDQTTLFNSHTLGDDLAEVIEQTTTGPVVVVGHSLGGMTALSRLVLEQRERERIVGAVIVNSSFTAELAGWRGRGNVAQRALEGAGDALQRVAGDDPALIDRFRTGANDLAFLVARALFGKDPSPRHIAVAFHMFSTTSSQTLAAAFALADFDVHAQLASIDVPTLVIAGSRDILTPLFLSKEIAARIPDAELVVLEGCGHMGPFERHGDVVAHVRKFAEQLIS